LPALKKDPNPGGPTTDGSTIYTDQWNNIVDRAGGEALPTANRAAQFDASSNITPSSVTSTELGHLSGVTSAIQTQLDGKAASAHTHPQSDITNLVTDLAAKEATANKGVANGYCELGADGKVPASRLTEKIGITALSDVSITAAASGDFLRHNGVNWEDSPIQPGDLPAHAANHNPAGSDPLQKEVVSGQAEDTAPDGLNDFVLSYDASANALKKVKMNNLPSSGGGEANTASNVGTAGVGVFKQKTGVNLEFKKINAGSSKVAITDDTVNSEVDIDVNQANLSINKSQVPDFAHQATHQTGGSDAISGLLDATARTAVRKNTGTDVGARRRLNIIEGNRITAAITDDLTNEEIDITLATTAEANTVSNIGTAGVGVYKQKVGENFEFKKINAASTKIIITDDTINNEIDLDVDPANISLTDLAGVLDEVQGGTGISTYALGDTLYGSALDTLSRLAGNTTTTKKFLAQTGTGTASAAPAWSTIVAGDLPAHSHSGADITSGTVADARLSTNVVLENQANTYTAGSKQTVEHSSTIAGLNVKPAAGDPSTPADGDIWYNSTTGKFRKRENGATSDLDTGGGGGAPTDAEYWVNTKHTSLTANKLNKRIIKTVDETLTNSTVLQNDNELSVALEANKRYGFSGLILHAGPAAADMNATFIGPTGATGNWNTHGEQSGTNSLGASKTIVTTTTQRQWSFVGYVKTSTTAGSLVFQWAQAVADTGTNTVYEGSYLEVWEA
jgi:hypothetical protein